VKQLLLVLLIVSLSVACRKPVSSTAAPAGGTAPAASANATAATPPAAQAKPVPEQLPAILARVNGEAIERWELESAVRDVEARAGAPMPAEQRNEVLRGMLEQLVSMHLLAQEARTRNVTVADADVKGRIDQARQGFQSEDAFQKALAADGGSIDRLQRDITRRLQISKLLDQEITPKVSVQDNDIKAFYDQNLERFKESDSIRASHILIAIPPNANAADKQQARAKADVVLKKVQGGADFAQLARAESQDRGSAENGGDLGFFGKGQMVPPFEAAAFNLKPGEVSPVVETQFGFHIIKHQEQRAARTTPLAEVNQQIAEYLRAQQGEEKTAAFVEQLKAKAKVDMYV
jgi:peptidyl-prolyl cis-trans isomerase C